MNRPDHNTLNRFRSERLKDILKEIFAQVVKTLCNQIKIENWYNPDGYICYSLLSVVVYFVTANRLTRSRMGFIYNILVNYCNMYACQEDL